MTIIENITFKNVSIDGKEYTADAIFDGDTLTGLKNVKEIVLDHTIFIVSNIRTHSWGKIMMNGVFYDKENYIRFIRTKDKYYPALKEDKDKRITDFKYVWQYSSDNQKVKNIRKQITDKNIPDYQKTQK
jgi:hypothetical protein